MTFDDKPYDEIENFNTIEEKKKNWDTAFGLQKADNLEPSKYIQKLADENIYHDKSYHEIQDSLYQYYEENADASRAQEADISSLRIAEILSEPGFSLAIGTYLSYHRHIFQGIPNFDHPVGAFRTTNLSKKEEILMGQSVVYADFRRIKDTLDYDFAEEKKFDYNSLSKSEAAHHVMEFISNIWQVHPFREGNTRTTAVFAIKYLETFGFLVDNKPFQENAKFFRNALVLAHASYASGYKTNKYLNMFTENILLGFNHKLEI